MRTPSPSVTRADPENFDRRNLQIILTTVYTIPNLFTQGGQITFSKGNPRDGGGGGGIIAFPRVDFQRGSGPIPYSSLDPSLSRKL